MTQVVTSDKPSYISLVVSIHKPSIGLHSSLNAPHFSLALICTILQDYDNNWRETALVLTSILFLAAGIWFIGNVVNFYYPNSEPPIISIVYQIHPLRCSDGRGLAVNFRTPN